jgi:hypothetical protein
MLKFFRIKDTYRQGVPEKLDNISLCVFSGVFMMLILVYAFLHFEILCSLCFIVFGPVCSGSDIFSDIFLKYSLVLNVC